MRVGWGVRVHAFKCTCICVDYVHVHAGMCIRYAYVGVCPRAQVYMHICGICIHVCRCVCMYVCVFTCVCTCICVRQGTSQVSSSISPFCC